MHLLKSSTLVGASISFTALSLLAPLGHAQETELGGITVTMSGVSARVPVKGRTEQLNVSQGQRTTLSVGNSVTLGTSAQFTSSIGSVSLSRSVLEPTRVSLTSSIGAESSVARPNTTGGFSSVSQFGVTNINIENITANAGPEFDADGNLVEGGGTINSSGGSDMNVGADSKFASGKAEIEGMTATSIVEVETDPSKNGMLDADGNIITGTDGKPLGKGRAEYFASANPQVLTDNVDPFYRDLITYEENVTDANGNIVHYKGEPVLDEDGNRQYTGRILITKDPSGNPTTGVLGEEGDSGMGIMKGTEGDDDYWETVNGCVPTAANGCLYEKADELKTGNASANSSYATNTNIDINSNAFTNVFGQAF